MWEIKKKKKHYIEERWTELYRALCKTQCTQTTQTCWIKQETQHLHALSLHWTVGSSVEETKPTASNCGIKKQRGAFLVGVNWKSLREFQRGESLQNNICRKNSIFKTLFLYKNLQSLILSSSSSSFLISFHYQKFILRERYWKHLESKNHYFHNLIPEKDPQNIKS